MEGIYKNCQSCGTPLSKDPLGGGINADGTTSGKYCSLCFIDGRFTKPDMTVADMQALVKARLRYFGFPAPMGWSLARSIPKLERWKLQ